MPWDTQYFLIFPLLRLHINLRVFLLANMRRKAIQVRNMEFLH